MNSIKPIVIQEEVTGCGIASVANIVGKTYAEMKTIANSIGIYADDKSLWSDTGYVRKLLVNQGCKSSTNEILFTAWDDLPDLALLSIKHHQEQGVNFWHWVVFRRQNGEPVVLDSNANLANNMRTDFEAMHPKWFIEVENA